MKHKTTPDQYQYCLAVGIELLPSAHSEFIEQLSEMVNKGLISLLPATIFETYHTRLAKKLRLNKRAA